MSTTKREPTVISHEQVGFVPRRFFPTIGEHLQCSTAANLVREFGECPECGHDIDPDVTDAVQSDRDVLWSDTRTNVMNGRTPLDRSQPHVCGDCGATLNIMVEESARPAQWSEVSDEHWAPAYLWIEMANGNYFVTNPGDIRIHSIDN